MAPDSWGTGRGGASRNQVYDRPAARMLVARNSRDAYSVREFGHIEQIRARNTIARGSASGSRGIGAISSWRRARRLWRRVRVALQLPQTEGRRSEWIDPHPGEVLKYRIGPERDGVPPACLLRAYESLRSFGTTEIRAPQYGAFP